jgi:tetratricopeptide (TPR) repeat protein
LADANANTDAFFTQAYAAKGMQKFVVDFFFAKFLLAHNQFEEAKSLIESALEVGEKDFDGDDLNIAAIIFYKNNDLDKAEELYLKSIALNPNNADVICNLASIYMDQEKWQKVAETADLALKADENNAMANMYMAIGLKKTGNEEMAIRFQEKAKRLEAEQKN